MGRHCTWLQLSWLGVTWTLTAREVSAQLLEFRGSDDVNELYTVSPDLPARLCLRVFEQPPRWAWPVMQVRLRLQFEDHPTDGASSWSSWKDLTPGLDLSKQTGPPGLFCRWLGPIAGITCQDCTRHCPVKPTSMDFGMVGSREVAATLPASGGCIVVKKLPPRVEKARAFWDTYLDPSVFFHLFAGLVLVWGWKPLSQSVAVHAGLGGVGALVFIVLTVGLWVFRGVRGTIQGTVPFGRSVTTLGTMVFAAVPAARDIIIQRTLSWLPALDWSAWLGVRDPWYDLPIGWLALAAAIFGCCSLIILGANLSVKYFASFPEPEGEVDFVIGSDGQREDLLPPTPASQKLLAWTFWLFGCSMLLSSTHLDGCSLVILILALLKDYIIFFVQMIIVSLSSDDLQPADLRPLVSQSEMQQQAMSHTEKALAALQQHIRANPRIVGDFRADSELRLRRFADGGAHAHPPIEEVRIDSASRCAVQ
mmetsp:Transcript_73759/g.130265  ORF Transcript_73759/g.130265 Transcript_73759/m.130265 type:complete len:479 (-) Transcript_73759:90-1526(-)